VNKSTETVMSNWVCPFFGVPKNFLETSVCMSHSLRFAVTIALIPSNPSSLHRARLT
jgi:Na+-translocating ferredoxin:NAD+ oxidoreductase RnfA subunit